MSKFSLLAAGHSLVRTGLSPIGRAASGLAFALVFALVSLALLFVLSRFLELP
jgi:hypothetical protein